MSDDPKPQINECTVIIRGTKLNNNTNYHETFDLDTTKDYEGCEFNGAKYNIRHDSYYVYPPEGIWGVPARIKGWTYRKLRERFDRFKRRTKIELCNQFEEGSVEPVTHRDVVLDPNESTHLLSRVHRSPIFRESLNECLQPEHDMGSIFLYILIGVVIIAVIFIANSQLHFLPIGNVPTPTPTPPVGNGTITMG